MFLLYSLMVVLWYVPRQTAPGGLLESCLFLRWLSVMILPPLFFLQFMRATVNGRAFRVTGISVPLALFAAWSVFSAAANRSGFLDFFGNLAVYINYPIFFITLVNMDLPEDTAKKMIRLFMALVIIQIPECLYRYYAMGVKGDMISWTLGPWGSFDLGVYMCYAVSIMVAVSIVKKFNWIYLIIIFSFFLVALFGEIKAFIFAAPITATAAAYFAAGRGGRLRKTLLTVLLPVILFLLVYLSFIYWGRVYGEGENFLAAYYNKVMGLLGLQHGYADGYAANYESRISGLGYAWRSMSGDIYRMMTGFGPGSSFMGNILSRGAIHSVVKIPAVNQLAAVLVDSGLVGLCLYVSMMVYMFSVILKANSKAESGDSRVITASLAGMWVFYAVMGPFYDLVWRYDAPSFMFYFLMSLAYLKAAGPGRRFAGAA